MIDCHLDWESKSTLDLREVGLWRYSHHATTDIWCGAYAFGDEEPELWVPGQPCPARIVEHVKAGGRILAWNAPFEMALWFQIATPRYGWPEISPSQFFCSMAKSYAMSMPGALDDAALALGLDINKDPLGRAIMLRACMPWKTNPTRWLNECPKLTVGGVTMTGEEAIARLFEYCKQDTRVERAADARLMPLSDRERKVWLLDYKINQRGVMIDKPSADGAVVMAEKVKENCDVQIAKITEGKVTSVNALAALKEFLVANGVSITGLAKQDVIDLLQGPLPDRVRQCLVLRQEAGKASTAKFAVMQRQADEEDRVHNLFQYHGAGTGRWAGRALQTHNLVRDMPKPEAVEQILQYVREGNHSAIDAVFGPPLTMLSKCTRSFFVAPSGKTLASGDFSNVEGRGQAWFAGEDWKLKAYVAADNKTGPGLYELAFSRMFNVPVESVKNPSEERQVGKVAELAFGYQGGVGSFHKMGKNYNVKVSDAKADEFKNAWRSAHPKIKACWYDIDRAATGAVRNAGETYACGHGGRQARFRVVGSFLWCLLPSGRAICFPYPKLLEGEYGPQLTYMCAPNPDTKIIACKENSSNWKRTSAYGGSLFNNIVQGFCRDFLADLMLALDAKGAQIVLHTHDDCNIEVDEVKAEGARAAMEGMMRTPPAWATGFPLHADVKLMRRYGK